MKALTGIAVLPLLLQLTACSTTAGAARSAQSHEATLTQREHELTNALVRRKSAVINEILAKNFTCSVKANREFELNNVTARFSVCTALGHERPVASGSRPEWISKLENQTPRSAEINSLQVSRTDDTAVVVSEQTYRNWFPYDGPMVRRSTVTDTWVLQDGKWLLQERISVPHPNPESTTAGL